MIFYLMEQALLAKIDTLPLETRKFIYAQRDEMVKLANTNALFATVLYLAAARIAVEDETL